MFVVDTNVLIYAADLHCTEHKKCRKLLERWREGILPWYVTWNIIYEFVRVISHPRVFRQPWSGQEAWTFVEALLASESVGILMHTERHPAIMRQTLVEVPGLRGNLVHDANTAVLMREHGIRTIYTRDSDFHRFTFLEVIDPLV